jgi:hypothetical protein
MFRMMGTDRFDHSGPWIEDDYNDLPSAEEDARKKTGETSMLSMEIYDDQGTCQGRYVS